MSDRQRADSERVVRLIEAARQRIERYQYAEQQGATGSATDLDEAVALLRTARGALDATDARRAQVAQALGVSLLTRYLTGGRAAADRDAAIGYLAEASAPPGLGPENAEMTLLCSGMLLMLRSLPGGAESGGSESATTPGDPARRADLDAAIGTFQRLLAGAPVSGEVHAVARAVLPQLTLLRGLLGGGLPDHRPLWTEGSGFAFPRSLLGPGAFGLPDGTGPGLAATASALRTLGIDVLVELVPADASGPGRLQVVAARGPAVEVPAPELRVDPDGPVAVWAKLVNGPLDAAWRTALDEVCGWAGGTVLEPLRAYLADRAGTPRVAVAAPGALAHVPWHAARTGSPARYACAELVLSVAAGRRQLVELAARPATPDGVVVVATCPTDGDPAGTLLDDGAVSVITPQWTVRPSLVPQLMVVLRHFLAESPPAVALHAMRRWALGPGGDPNLADPAVWAAYRLQGR
jgi:hypothetical protein